MPMSRADAWQSTRTESSHPHSLTTRPRVAARWYLDPGEDGRKTLPAKISVLTLRPFGMDGGDDAAPQDTKRRATRSIREPSGIVSNSWTRKFRNLRATSQRSGGTRKASDEKNPYW